LPALASGLHVAFVAQLVGGEIQDSWRQQPLLKVSALIIPCRLDIAFVYRIDAFLYLYTCNDLPLHYGLNLNRKPGPLKVSQLARPLKIHMDSAWYIVTAAVATRGQRRQEKPQGERDLD